MKSLIPINDTFVWATFFFSVAVPVLLVLLLRIFYRRESKTNSSSRLPPGPPGWPVIGNLFDLGKNPHKIFKRPHQMLVELQQRYGPVFMLRLGAVNTLVIGSADVAMEFFKNHDQAFLNRVLAKIFNVVVDEHGHNMTPFNQHGPHWRMMRRLYATKLFSGTMLQNTIGKRRRFVERIIEWISVEEKAGRSVELNLLIFISQVNLIGDLLFSRDLMDLKSGTRDEFYVLVNEIATIIKTPNLADLFPWLGNSDPQNLTKRMKKAWDAALNIVDGIAKERRRMGLVCQNDEHKDFLDVLMDFEGDGKDEAWKFSDRQINLFVLELVAGSTDTIASVIEWAMTELLRNPEAMKKVNAEIAQVVGYVRKIEEKDIESLPYLWAVIKEALRLHPVAPFLIPRIAVEDTKFMGYMIPKDTVVLVNAWGIGRESASWDDPYSFNPDRFLGTNINYHGQHFGFLPFGSGRRICPGIPLTQQVLPIVLGSLLQSFDWALESGVTPESIDMGESYTVVLTSRFH
ncbi:hypothetical protein MKX01_041319 [Papaver californicum]|nr:hypothetical protein MKX01_041319 [Papaver californicum]